jgi:hypothetical protein
MTRTNSPALNATLMSGGTNYGVVACGAPSAAAQGEMRLFQLLQFNMLNQSPETTSKPEAKKYAAR